MAENAAIVAGRWRPDRRWPDFLLLAALVGVAAWVPAQMLVRASVHGVAWGGVYGIFPVDEFQYLAWIRDASRHGLASNLFVLHPTAHDFLQPGIEVSAGLVALGVAPWVALLIWQPVALVAVFVAVRELVRRQVSGRRARWLALALALFAGWGTMYVDLWLPFWSWGYPFSLLGLACAVGALLFYQDAWSGERSIWPAAVLALLASWLHPWQGEILVALVVGAELLLWRQGRTSSLRRALPVLVAAALPLAYFVVLDRADPAWRLAQRATIGTYGLSALARAQWPLALAALLAYRIRPRTFLQAATRLWPVVALVVFVLAEHRLGSGPMHAFLGITVPLSVLAVEGVCALPWRRLAGRRASRLSAAGGALAALAAVAALTVPCAIRELRFARRLIHREAPITVFDQRGLDYLARDRTPGGVLTTFELGMLVPADTGRHTYLGDCFWSLPGCKRRGLHAWLLLDRGHLSTIRASAFVRATGARFVLRACGSRGDVLRELRPILASVRRFGCAAVYQISAPAPPDVRLGADAKA